MPKFSEAVFGTSAKQKKLSLIDKGQQDLMNLVREGLEKGTGPFADIFGKFNEAEFNQGVRDPALKNFKDNVLPMLQEQFINRGDVSGSGRQRAEGRAATDLQSKLNELMYKGQQDQKQNRISGANTYLGRQTVENLHIPGTEGLFQGAVKSFAQGAGSSMGGGIPGAGASPGVGTPGGSNAPLVQQARGIQA